MHERWRLNPSTEALKIHSSVSHLRSQGVDVFVRDAWLREGVSVGLGEGEGEGEGEGVQGGMRSWCPARVGSERNREREQDSRCVYDEGRKKG
jgi:hypothetical protein